MGMPIQESLVVEIVQGSSNWAIIIGSIIAAVIGLVGSIITVRIRNKKKGKGWG